MKLHVVLSWAILAAPLLSLCACGKSSTPVAVDTPTVALFYASAHTSEKVPAAITLDATASIGVDGPIQKYEWDFEGDGHYDLTTTTPTVTYQFVKKGESLPRLRVTDSAGGTAVGDLQGGPIMLAKGWSTFVVKSGIAMTSPTAVLINPEGTDQRYMVAFVDSKHKAVDVEVSFLGNAEQYQHDVTVSTDTTFTKHDVSLAMVNTHPAVVFTSDEGDNTFVKYARAATVDGATWGAPVTVSASGHGTSSLMVFNSTPMVAWITETGKVGFTHSLDTRGAAWATTVIAAPSGTSVVTFPDVSFGVPLPGMVLLNGTATLRNAKDTLGADWFNGTSAPLGTLVANSTSTLSFQSVAGLHAVAYSKASGTPNGTYFRERDPNVFPSNQIETPVGPTNSNTVQFLNLRIFKGKPIICGYDAVHHLLFAQKATDANGATWGPVEVVDNLGNAGRFCSMATESQHNLILIAYLAPTSQLSLPGSLKVAIWN